jgi:hypothetical protein
MKSSQACPEVFDSVFRVAYKSSATKGQTLLSEPVPASKAAKEGIEVSITEPFRLWNLAAEGLIQELNEKSAPYI